MPQANDPSSLSQGSLLNVSDAVWGTPTGNQVTITSAGSGLPPLDANEFFEVRKHPQTVNNGLYRATGTPTAGSVTADKVSGSNPVADAVARAVEFFSAVDTAVSNMVFQNATAATATTANRVDITSATNLLPAMAVGERFEVENHSNADNNGAYEVIAINTSQADYTCTKLLNVGAGNGNEPANAASEAADTVTERKTVMLDTAGLGAYLLEQGGIDGSGASGQAVYSFAMIEYGADTFLRANSPFPMRCIDADAGKYLIGQDANGNNSGWKWMDDADIALGNFGIRTRKLLRNAGWNEIDSAGSVLRRFFGCLTVDTVENPAADTAFGMFGTDTAVDNTFDLTFPGAVNEAVEFYTLIGTLSGSTPSYNANGTDIDRVSGSFITDGFVVGGQITIIGSTSNDGTYVITAITATKITVNGTLTNEAWGASTVAVNNDNGFRLGMRERDNLDTYGSTFAEADLNTINKSSLGNFVFQFPLKTGPDLKITATDATITAGGNVYANMSLTFHSTPQSRGAGGGLVGGPYNFGIIMAGNNGTDEECFAFIQWSLRQLSDIDADADTNIGRAIGLLARYVGEKLEVGSADGGTTQAVNPNGGGSGFYIDALNSQSDNSVVFFDNLGVGREKPTAVSVTMDGNETLNNDAVSDGTLFFVNTIENSVTDLVINAGTGANGTFTSAGANLPASLFRGAGAYVEIAGLTGDDAAMNGIYQVTALTSQSSWNVTRYDGATIATTTVASLTIDENPLDSPDAIIVWTNVKTDGGTNNVSFTAGNTISQTAIDTIFSIGDFIEVLGSTSNDGIWEVTGTGAGTLTVTSPTGLSIVTEAASAAEEIYKIVHVPMQTDYSFSFDFSNNDQGGRTGGTTAKVKAKALGRQTAQYTESTVASIDGTVAVNIPLVAQGELNVTV